MTVEEYREIMRQKGQVDYSTTNPWAEWSQRDEADKRTKREKAQKKAAATRLYKSAAVSYFQTEQVQRFGKCDSYDDRKANDLQRFILDWLDFHGHYGARINTGGVPIGATGAGGREVIKWATSGATKGVADVIACLRGRFCQFEVKAGRDRPREDQLEQQKLTRSAGGSYEFIHSADEFVRVAGAILGETITTA